MSSAPNIEVQRIGQGLVGEIEFSLQVDVLPAHGRYVGDGIGQGLPLGGWGLKQLLIQNTSSSSTQSRPKCLTRILHEPFAGIGVLLFFLAGVAQLAILPVICLLLY